MRAKLALTGLSYYTPHSILNKRKQVLRAFCNLEPSHRSFINNTNKKMRLTHLMRLISFDTPWKDQKTSGFLMFARSMKRDQWHEMG